MQRAALHVRAVQAVAVDLLLAVAPAVAVRAAAGFEVPVSVVRAADRGIFREAAAKFIGEGQLVAFRYRFQQRVVDGLRGRARVGQGKAQVVEVVGLGADLGHAQVKEDAEHVVGGAKVQLGGPDIAAIAVVGNEAAGRVGKVKTQILPAGLRGDLFDMYPVGVIRVAAIGRVTHFEANLGACLGGMHPHAQRGLALREVNRGHCFEIAFGELGKRHGAVPLVA